MIVILYPQFHAVGGIARYLDSWLANLPATGPRVVLVTGRPPAGVARTDALQACEAHDAAAPARRFPARVQIESLPLGLTRWGLLRWSWLARRRVAALHREEPIEVLNLHLPPLLPGLFLGRDWPVVLTAHSTYRGMLGRLDASQLRRRPRAVLGLKLGMAIKSRLEHAQIARADHVITLTEQGRQELAACGRRDGVSVVPNGVDLRVFHPGDPLERDIDVLFAGRIEPMKGSAAMVAVCQRLVASRPGVRVLIAGTGDDAAAVRAALAPWPAQIAFTGQLGFDAMAACNRRSRVYVSTSYYEGLPGTCLEAMATGLPAVVWRLPFYRQLVSDGVTGLSAPVDDVAALTAHIVRLLDDPALAADLGAQGRARVAARHDWRRLGAQLMDVLHCVARSDSDSRSFGGRTKTDTVTGAL